LSGQHGTGVWKKAEAKEENKGKETLLKVKKGARGREVEKSGPKTAWVCVREKLKWEERKKNLGGRKSEDVTRNQTWNFAITSIRGHNKYYRET